MYFKVYICLDWDYYRAVGGELELVLGVDLKQARGGVRNQCSDGVMV